MLLFNVLGKLPGQLFLDTLLDTCLSKPCLGTCSWEPCLRSLFLGTLLVNLLLGALPGNLFLGTPSWEPVLGNFACLLQNLFIGNWSGTCSSQLCLGALFRNLSFGTLLGISVLASNLACRCSDVLRNFALQVVLGKLFLGTWATWNPCLGTCSWEPCWQPIARNLPREFVLETRTCSWEPVLRTLAWEPVLAKLACKPVLGNLAWGPVCGNLAWEPVPKDLAW